MRNCTRKLGAAIKSARKSKNLTQMELSEELGITPRYLQAIENENKTPSYHLLFRILSYLNIPIELDPREISVLLSTAKALVDTREKVF